MFKITNLLYKFYEAFLWPQIKNGPRPHHIGLIVDGNRRFAKDKGQDIEYGHKLGIEKIEDFLNWCWRLDIKVITLFAFSTENFNRTQREVEHLMQLIHDKLRRYRNDPLIGREKIKIKVIGQRDKLSDALNFEISETEKMTAHHDRFQLNIAIGYGGRAEIVDAVKSLAHDVKSGSLRPDDITEEILGKNLYTTGIPDPDLIIRTSGEERLSGFLLWQSAYSELYFTEVYWPAFRMIDLWRAIRIYQQRERRFGR